MISYNPQIIFFLPAPILSLPTFLSPLLVTTHLSSISVSLLSCFIYSHSY